MGHADKSDVGPLPRGAVAQPQCIPQVLTLIDTAVIAGFEVFAEAPVFEFVERFDGWLIVNIVLLRNSVENSVHDVRESRTS